MCGERTGEGGRTGGQRSLGSATTQSAVGGAPGCGRSRAACDGGRTASDVSVNGDGAAAPTKTRRFAEMEARERRLCVPSSFLGKGGGGPPSRVGKKCNCTAC